MKKTTTLLKISLVGLFLAISTTIYAQTAPNPTTPIMASSDLDVGTIDNDETTVTPVATAVVFYNPGGSSITLEASETDVVTGLAYSSYLWHEIAQDGIISETLAEEGRQLVVTGLEPGYYRYRVYGYIDDDGVICQSDDYQDLVFFVLRPLALTAGTGLDAITEFCLNEIPEDALALEVDVDFDAAVDYNDNSFTQPTVDEFAMTYRWYAINSNDAATQIPLTEPATATNAGAENAISLDYEDLTAIGTYTFHVEVQYSDGIKAREDRSHALWTAQVLNDEGAPFELVVTPIPGRPTITIESVVD